MTRIASDQTAIDDAPEQRAKGTQFQSIKIMDQVFEEPYTAYVTKICWMARMDSRYSRSSV